MVTRSLFTGVSGLQAHMERTDVIANNISNINTPGFKKSNVQFSSFLSQRITAGSTPDADRGGTNPEEIGLGVQVGSINKNMSQGQLERTGVGTDLAIQGEGFFATQEAGSGREIYTRAGGFEFDRDQNLVDPATGNLVLGDMVNEDFELADIGDSPMKIEAFMRSMDAEATTQMEFSGNLNADQQIGMESIRISDFSPGDSEQESDIRFDFQRFHPEERIYRFEAVWASNPPAGRQVGSKVRDQITGENMEGLVRLNEDDSVEGVYMNSDSSGMNGVGKVEVAADNSAEFEIDANQIYARNQTRIFDDLPDRADEPPQLRIRRISDEELDEIEDLIDDADDIDDPSDIHSSLPDDIDALENPFTVEWYDVEASWNEFTVRGDDNGEDVFIPVLGEFEDLTEDGDGWDMYRTDDDGNVRHGEFRIEEGFARGVDFDELDADDQIYFQINPGTEQGILEWNGQLVGEEPRDDFRWGGREDGNYIARTPSTTEGDGELDGVYVYDEDVLDDISNTTRGINGIENKEFRIVFDEDEITGTFDGDEEFEVQFYLEDEDDPDDDQWVGFFRGNTNNDQRLLIDEDVIEGEYGFDVDDDFPFDAGAEVGIEIAAENWSGTGDNDVMTFTVTRGRSTGEEERAYSLVRDRDGEYGSMFLPNEGATAPTFEPDTVGLTDYEADGDTEDVTINSDERIQVTASAEAYDSQGAQHTLTYRFERQDSNRWMWHVMDPAPEDSDNPRMAGFGVLSFDSDGGMETARSTNYNSPVAFNQPPPGPSNQDRVTNVFFNPPEGELQPDEEGEMVGADPVMVRPDMTGLTQYAGESDAEIDDQDGHAAGSLEEKSFDEDGFLNAAYDNGEDRILGRISLARFRNPEGLQSEGGTYFSTSPNSGEASLRYPGQGGRGTLAPGTLERSNVDMSEEFTMLISTQRGYQANSRTISTTDEMIMELLRLR